MSALPHAPEAAAPEHAPDPDGLGLNNRDWWRAVEGSRPSHQPQTPTLILPGFANLERFDDLDALGARLAGLLDGRTPVLVRSVAAYPGFDTFPAFSLNALAPAGDNGGPPAATYVATLAVQRATAEQVEQAIAGAALRRAA